MYSATTNQVKKTISRFGQCAYSACFRRDGQLIAAGSEEGVVKVGCAWIEEAKIIHQAVDSRYLMEVAVPYSVSSRGTPSESSTMMM